MNNKRWTTLSDKELQRELVAKGFPKMPVTETTRGIIIRKLQNASKTTNARVPQYDRLDSSTYSTYSEPNDYKEDIENDNVYDYKTVRNTGNYISSRGINSKSFNYSPQPLHMSNVEKTPTYLTKEDFANISRSPANSDYLAHRSHHGVVNRLLSFREKALKQRTPWYTEQNKKAQTSLSKETSKYMDKFYRKIVNIVTYFSAQSTLNQSFIPYLLVSAFVAFFVLIGIMYLFSSPNTFEINENISHIPMCKDSTELSCIRPDRINTVVGLIKVLLKILKHRTNREYCGKNNFNGITETEVLEYLHQSGFAYEPEELRQNLISAAVLIENNPQWILTVEKLNSLSPKYVKDVHEENALYFAVKSHASIICVIYKKIQKCFVIIGIGAIIVAILSLSYLSYRYIKAWKMNRNNIVEQFTTEIVNELIYRASLNEAPEEREIIINHLRDKIIPLNKRNSYLGFWNEALRILQANDSRIQFGTTFCNGEECRTMKWIGNAQSTVQMGSLKKWQSPAFDSSNKILNPPTPCLKIRHMFDPTEANCPNIKQIIEAAILEKVGSRCRIYDIQLDKQSCCVYVRCASEADAGIIHNEINGWWFDKRLISIKFLRLQRYFARFPNTSITKQN